MLTFVFGFLAELARETGAWLDRLLPLPRLRHPLRHWRRSRPFWAGVLAVAGGVELIALPLAPLPLMLRVGVGALSAVAIGLVMITGGLFFVFAPHQRLFVSVVTAIASLTSLATSNLGGLGIGCGLGLLGSSMAFGWVPHAAARAAEDTERAGGQGYGRGHGRGDGAALPVPVAATPTGTGSETGSEGAEASGPKAAGGPTATEGPTPAEGPTAGQSTAVDGPKAGEGRRNPGAAALTLAMPLVLAAALTAALPATPAAADSAPGGCGSSSGTGTGGGSSSWLPLPDWPWTPGSSGDCTGGGGGGAGTGGTGGSGDHSGQGKGTGTGTGKGGGENESKKPEPKSNAAGDPRKQPAKWQLPCLTGVDTGGAPNRPTGPPPSQGGTAKPTGKTAEPGRPGGAGDLTPVRPPLVIGGQPAPGRAEYAVSPHYPTVDATRLDAYDAIIHGATYLRTPRGRIKVLWVHAKRIVAKNYRLSDASSGHGRTSLGVQLDIRNVDVYATYLNGSIEIPGLKVDTPRICIGADVIPANLPVAVQLPELSLTPVRAGQVLVDTSDVRFGDLDGRESTDGS